MNGLERKSDGITFLSMARGNIVLRVKEKTENSESRILTMGPNKGAEVHEELYTSLTGVLIDIRINDHPDYGKSYSLIIAHDSGDMYNLKFNRSSPYTSGILLKLENCDLSRAISIHTSFFEKDEKVRAWVRQDDKTVPSKYTKEEPNGLPPLESREWNDEVQWSDFKMMKFVDENILPKILEKIKGNTKTLNPDEAELRSRPTEVDEPPPVSQRDYHNDDDFPI